jgi:hypothetical protein
MRHTLVVLALLAAACGGADVIAPPSSTAGVTTTVITALGGDFYPFQVAGDGFPHPDLEMRPTFVLERNGCWTAELGTDGPWLVAFPEGSTWSGDRVPVPSGLVVTDGLLAEARGGLVYGTESLSVPWAALADFCGLDRVAVMDSIDVAFDPDASSPSELVDLLRSAELTRSWDCGYGFTQSDQAGRVELVVMADTDPLPDAAKVTLPAAGWTASVTVGAHLMVQHCDDVAEAWEPDRIVGAAWPVVGGTLTFTEVPTTGGPVRAVLSGGMVETDDGVVELGDVELVNACWGCFAG